MIRSTNSIRVATSAIAIAVGLTVLGPNGGPHAASAAAFCASDWDHQAHVAGTQTLASTSASGIRAHIAYVNGVVCQLVSPHYGYIFENVTICQSSDCFGDGWVQVGYYKGQGWTEPKMYCEFTPENDPNPQRILRPFEISNQAHDYKVIVTHSEGQDEWACSVDGVVKMAYATSYLGFSSGTYLVAQGETNNFYSQIGRNAPDTLHYSNMDYYSSGWQTFNVTLFTLAGLGGHYGHSEPNPGEFDDWTN
jgi:hypothetical protein